MRRFLVLLTATLLALAGAGCFVMDELDQGAAMLDHEPAEQEASDRKEAPSMQPGVLDRVVATAKEVEGWWSSVGTPTPSADPVVECNLGATRSYTTEPECLARGGWIRP